MLVPHLSQSPQCPLSLPSLPPLTERSLAFADTRVLGLCFPVLLCVCVSLTLTTPSSPSPRLLPLLCTRDDSNMTATMYSDHGLALERSVRAVGEAAGSSCFACMHARSSVCGFRCVNSTRASSYPIWTLIDFAPSRGLIVCRFSHPRKCALADVFALNKYAVMAL